jgi:hypothetical protein
MLAVGGFSGVVLLVVHLVVYLAGKTWQKGDKKEGKRRGGCYMYGFILLSVNRIVCYSRKRLPSPLHPKTHDAFLALFCPFPQKGSPNPQKSYTFFLQKLYLSGEKDIGFWGIGDRRRGR